MTSILAITKKAGKERPGISNSVRVALKSLHIEKWSVKDFLMEFLVASFSLYSNFHCYASVEISRKRSSCCLDDDAERSSKCSLYGCQQVVNRKLSIHRLKLRLKVNLKIVENWTVKKIQVDMQVRNCRCCLAFKKLLTSLPPDGLISGAWYNYSSSCLNCIMNKEVMTLQLPILKMSCLECLH